MTNASIVMSISVCVSVSLSARISPKPHAREIFLHVAHGRGSVLLRRRCDTLCASGFVDFSIMGRIAV